MTYLSETERRLDPEFRRKLIELRRPPPADANRLRLWWHRRRLKLLSSPTLALGVYMRAGGLERDRKQFEDNLADAFTVIVATGTSGATSDEEAPHLGRVIARAYLSELESLMKGLLRNIARDVLLAPSLALTALVFLAWSDHVALDWTIVAGLLLGTGWIVWKGAYWADWAPFLAPRERLPFAEITSACGSVFALTASFAGLSYVLAGEGALAVAPAGQALSVWEAVGVFTWHLLDAVPLLEIPSTLNWELTPRFTDYVGGSFLLFYKLLVVIPVIRVIVALVQRRRHEPTASPTPASE